MYKLVLTKILIGFRNISSRCCSSESLRLLWTQQITWPMKPLWTIWLIITELTSVDSPEKFQRLQLIPSCCLLDHHLKFLLLTALDGLRLSARLVDCIYCNVPRNWRQTIEHTFLQHLKAADDVAANQTSRQLGSLLGGLFPNTPQCVYCTNCNFIGFDLYLVINILSPITCGNIICGGDSRCTHFVHDPNTNGGTCLLKQSAGSGGLWSTPVTSPSGVVCGHIPKRSCAPASLISLCLDLNLNIL